MAEMGYATKTLSSIPFGKLIGAPMNAAIEAQALAAKSTVDFIQAVGFEQKEEDPFAMEDDSDPDMGQVRNVVFQYKAKDKDGDEVNATLTVPILTIVPIPFIRIDEMTIDFMAKINEMESRSNKSTSSSDYKNKYGTKVRFGWWGWGSSTNFSASHSSKHSSTAASASKFQTEYTMNIHVRAVQDDIPAGLSRVLSILEAAIKDEKKEKQLTTAPA